MIYQKNASTSDSEDFTWARPLPTTRNRRSNRSEECPVARSEAMGGDWLTSRYQDCLEALNTPTVFSNTVMTLGQVEEVAEASPT